MGTVEEVMGGLPGGFDLEARWRGELGPQERQDVKAWSKMAEGLGQCELKIGKQRSRMSVRFDRSKLAERSRAQLGLVEAMLARQGAQGPSDAGMGEAARAVADLRRAPLDSAQGLLVKDYGEILARDWAIQSGAALQALLPARCGLKVSLASAQPGPGAGDFGGAR